MSESSSQRERQMIGRTNSSDVSVQRRKQGKNCLFALYFLERSRTQPAPQTLLPRSPKCTCSSFFVPSPRARRLLIRNPPKLYIQQPNFLLKSICIISIMGNMPCCQKDDKGKELEIVPSSSRRVHFDDQICSILNSEEHSNSHLATIIQTASNQEANASVRQKENLRGPQNYQSRKYLGKGAFGCVVLTEQKETGKLYAMKIIEKSKIKEFNVLQCELIKRIGKQQFLTSIRETFQNQTRIYIIMEYLPMGDLYFYLKKKEIPFTEIIIRGIIAEIVVGIGILHNYGLVYRELKPENLLVTDEGHIKLTDYGLSKVIVEDKKSIETFVGTLQYMAPEALSGEFGQKADIWSLGVLMFELMFRENPFEGEDKNYEFPMEDYKNSIEMNLINERINSKIGYMSLPFRDLLLKLLEKLPEKRITLEEIREHDFFKEMSWTDVEARLNPPPLRDIIEKHDYITFRDATNEEYIRKEVAKHRAFKDNYEIRLYEFRNSQ